jgi:hypothetical protein
VYPKEGGGTSQSRLSSTADSAKKTGRRMRTRNILLGQVPVTSPYGHGNGSSVDYSGRAVQGMNCLRLLKHWDRVNPTQDMDVCTMCVYSVFVLFCV